MIALLKSTARHQLTRLSPLLVVFLLLAPALPVGGEDPAAASGAKKTAGGGTGAKKLQAKRYDEVAYATTHNAMSNSDEGWLFPNQTHSLTRQLADGIRAFMLDVHDKDGKPYLCHSRFFLGSRPLKDGLGELAAYLGKNSREVITIIFESYVSSKALAGAFKESGLLRYAHSQPKGKPWPTLGKMVASGRRLVVFTDRAGGELPWLHRVWDFCWETHFSARSRKDLVCRKNRGDSNNSLFILNHFLTRPVASARLADEVNHNPFLKKRIEQCRKASGRLPNFITVDFYELGDVIAVVDELNGIR